MPSNFESPAYMYDLWPGQIRTDGRTPIHLTKIATPMSRFTTSRLNKPDIVVRLAESPEIQSLSNIKDWCSHSVFCLETIAPFSYIVLQISDGAGQANSSASRF